MRYFKILSAEISSEATKNSDLKYELKMGNLGQKMGYDKYHL